jgi:hypothetical protein
MNWQIQNQIKSLNLGDLIRVDWHDASVGKSSFSKSSIDIPSRRCLILSVNAIQSLHDALNYRQSTGSNRKTIVFS